jgi:hypothetical protein
VSSLLHAGLEAMMQGRRRTLGGPVLSVPFARAGGTGDFYSQPNADANDIAGQYPMSGWIVFQYVAPPAADAIILGKSNGLTNVNGWRWVLTTGGVLTARTGDGVNRVSATKTLTTGLWYIAHFTVAASGSLLLYVDGAAIGSPTAVGASYTVNTSNTGVFVSGNGSVPCGDAIRIAGFGATYVAMTGGQVATHVAAIKAAYKSTAPGLSGAGSEWNLSAEDATATWDEEIGTGAQFDRTAAVGFTYGTDASPSWGT